MLKDKRELGITLVALVITIIILLILAGITIAQLTGSGLFENARLAEQKYKEAEQKEQEILSDYENEISSATRNSNTSSNIEYKDVSTLESTYNPYGLKGFIQYDENTGILEVNLYENIVSIPNQSIVLNVGFIENLPTTNFTGTPWGTEKEGYEESLAGTGVGIYGGHGIFALRMNNNKDIRIYNTNDQAFSTIWGYTGKIKLK